MSVADLWIKPHLGGTRQPEVPMRGTVLDFLKLAAEKPELAQELVNLAAKHDFEFTDEVSDEQLEAVAGGTSTENIDTLGGVSEEMSLKLQMEMDRRAKTIQTLSNIIKKTSDTADGIVSNLK